MRRVAARHSAGMTSRTTCSAARQSPPEAMHHARGSAQPQRQRAAPSSFMRIELRRGGGRLEVLVRPRQQAVARDREHARVGALVRDRERDVDHREPGADQQHARHIGRKLLHPVQVPGVATASAAPGSGPAAGALPSASSTRSASSARPSESVDAGPAVLDIEARRARPHVLESEPARAAASRRARRSARYSPYQARGRKSPPLTIGLRACAHCTKSAGRSANADIFAAGTLSRQYSGPAR